MKAEFGDQLLINDGHISGVYDNVWASNRFTWYAASGSPHVRFDGQGAVGGSYGSPAANAAQYRTKINARLAQTGGLSPVLINGTYVINGDVVEVNVRFTLEDAVNLISPAAVIQLLEDDAGTYHFDHIVRAVHEEAVTLVAPGDYVDVSWSVTLANNPPNQQWKAEDVSVIAFLYKDTNRFTTEIYQAAPIPLLPDFLFAWDSPILSVPAGNGTALFEGTLTNVSGVIDQLTLELDNTFGWPAEYRVEGDPNWHTSAILIDLNADETIRIEMRVTTNGEVRTGEGALAVTSALSQRTQDTLAKVFNGSLAIFFVDDDGPLNDELALHGALDGANYLYDNWNVWTDHANETPVFEDLLGYDIVLWHQGSPPVLGLTADTEQALMAFMDGGGGVILSSQQYVSYPHTSAFRTDYLGVASYVSDVGDITQAIGVPGDPVGDGMAFDLTYPYPGINRPDDLVPNALGTVFLNSDGGHAIGMRAETASARSIYYSFCINELDDGSVTGPWPDTAELLGKSIEWLMPNSQGVDPGSHAAVTTSVIRGVTPNPFSRVSGMGQTTIQLHVSARAAGEPSSLEVVDVNGRLVRTLLQEPLTAGTTSTTWDGRDGRGQTVGAGLYYLRFGTVEGEHTARMVVLR